MQPGDTLHHRYLLTDQLGSGGQATTWRAHDTTGNSDVALKIQTVRGAHGWKPIELWERECQVLHTVHHAAVPKYIDSFKEQLPDGDVALCLVQELIAGQSLGQLQRAGERWSEKQLLDVAQQVLAVLRDLHNLNPPVVHRDIKPNNLMRRPDGQIALIDFGAVMATLLTATEIGSTVVGTAGFMAPEQLMGHAQPNSDLYALGATLIALASGRQPADLPLDNMRMQFHGVVHLPKNVVQWLDKMTAPMPADRFQTAHDALDALRHGQQPQRLPQPQPEQQPRRHQQRDGLPDPQRERFAKIIPGVVIGLSALFGAMMLLHDHNSHSTVGTTATALFATKHSPGDLVEVPLTVVDASGVNPVRLDTIHTRLKFYKDKAPTYHICGHLRHVAGPALQRLHGHLELTDATGRRVDTEEYDILTTNQSPLLADEDRLFGITFDNVHETVVAARLEWRSSTPLKLWQPQAEAAVTLDDGGKLSNAGKLELQLRNQADNLPGRPGPTLDLWMANTGTDKYRHVDLQVIWRDADGNELSRDTKCALPNDYPPLQPGQRHPVRIGAIRGAAVAYEIVLLKAEIATD